MSTADEDNDIVSVCANCGKEGRSDEINNICNKCKQVKYCNAACKKKHRHKHKKDCEEHQRLAAVRAAKLHDEALFKQPTQLYGDCPICFLRLPSLDMGKRYMSCCGKVICSGCDHAPLYDNQGNEVNNEKCPFCRIPEPNSNEEAIQRLNKRVDAGDANAMHGMGVCYRDGAYGFPQDYTKALELWQRAVEHGNTDAYNGIGYAYEHGQGVEVDSTKAYYYYELSAMRGNVSARFNIGNDEESVGNYDRALRHYMIATNSGHNKSLQTIKKLYEHHLATKEDYTKALQSYQEYLSEIKSSQRDKAAAADEEYRYY